MLEKTCSIYQLELDNLFIGHNAMTFCKIFSGISHLTIFGAPKYAYLAK